MGQKIKVEINKYNGTDYDWLLPVVSTQQPASIPTNGWVGSAPPYTLNVTPLTTSFIDANTKIEVLISPNATVEMVEAFQALNLQGGPQSSGSFTLRAFGEKNTISIPITIIITNNVRPD